MNERENPYLLLTPGPLSTTKSVKSVMMMDWCTWDDDYNSIIQSVRQSLNNLASLNPERFTTVLMQGSGTFSVESVIGSVIPPDGKLLILANGAYGLRLDKIAAVLKVEHVTLDFGDLGNIDIEQVQNQLIKDHTITHVAVVHCETTTGMLNDIESVGKLVKKFNKYFIVDAMSSFGGIPMDVDAIGIDYLISSANKCIQGVPGFGFIITRKKVIESIKGYARSLSLDLYDQWKTMETLNGKWRFTSPTHAVRAFKQALLELEKEGGIAVRYERYKENQKRLVSGMRALGFETLLPDHHQSPIITTFLSPEQQGFNFKSFYDDLKTRGFVIYPGKVTDFDCFRIGNIGDVYPEDIERLLDAIDKACYWKG